METVLSFNPIGFPVPSDKRLRHTFEAKVSPCCPYYCHILQTNFTKEATLNQIDFQIDRNEVLLVPSGIDGCLRKEVLVSLRKHILLTKHHSQVAGHCGERLIKNLVRRDHYGPHMAIGLFHTVRNGRTCAWNCKRSKQKRHLQLRPASGTFIINARDIQEPLPRT